jgi:predicted MFS family arabinose efflux permease
MFGKTLSLYKKAYSGLSPDTWWLCLVMLVNRSGTMVVPFMTIYLTSPRMGYSIAKAGLVMGFFGAGAILGGYTGGRVADKIGFYPVQIIALLGGGILFITLGQLHHFPLICLFTFLLSLVNESFRPANSIAIAHYSSENNWTRSYSLNRLAINLGWAVGGALGGLLATFNYTLLFWVDGCTNIAAAILMWYFLRPAVAKKPSTKNAVVKENVGSAYRDRIYIVFISLVVLFAACFFQMFSTLPAYFRNELHFSSFYIGLLLAVNGLIITFFEMVLIYQIEGKRKNTFYIAIGIFLTATAFVVLNILKTERSIALLMMILITFGEIFAMPFMNSFWISRSAHHNRGQYAGLYTIAWSTAQTFGPVLGSQVAQHAGFTTLWWIGAGICVVSATGFLFLDYLIKDNN